MPRSCRSQLSPWIEKLILSYGVQEGGSSSSSGRLKAHVIGVGQMSPSQAQGSESPTALLFLSDGALQIPAVLTASAWEHLQEQEDRECFTSLVNTTVCIQNYRLQFHMADEQVKCRFFLSVGELATTAAGPVKVSTPCCTTLPSVRQKICKTWGALLGQDSQESQCGFDLSDLLGEWRHDCLEAVLEDVQRRLRDPVSPQPSTSASASLPTRSAAFAATGWDVDRVRYKGMKCFSVPVNCLLIPEEDAQQQQTPPNVVSERLSGPSAAPEERRKDLPQVCEPLETTRPSVDDTEWQLDGPAAVQQDHDQKSPVPVEDCMLPEGTGDRMSDDDIEILSNLSAIFPPPCDTSDTAPEATPTNPLHKLAATQSKPVPAAILTSTQLPVHSVKESQQTSGDSKGEHSYLPPYQKPPPSNNLPAAAGSSTSASVSPPEPFSRLSNLPAATEESRLRAAQQLCSASDQEDRVLEKDVEEATDRNYREAKRKRGGGEEQREEAPISGNPPSWLFETQAASGDEEDRGHKRGQSARTVSRKIPAVHGGGRPFFYSYKASVQNQKEFARFTVAESLLHWAVKYLVPEREENPHVSLTSDITKAA